MPTEISPHEIRRLIEKYLLDEDDADEFDDE
jgi:hypothetical protein